MATAKQQQVTSVAVLNEILTQVKGDIADVKSDVKVMGEAISKLISVEQRQSDQNDRIEDAFKAITEVSKRLTTIEQEMPGLRETRRWVVQGIIAVAGCLGLAVIGLVLAPRYQMPAQYGSQFIVPGTAPAPHNEALIPRP